MINISVNSVRDTDKYISGVLFSCSFFISFLSDILVPVNSVTDTDKKLSAGLGVVNPARLKQLRLFTHTNCFSQNSLNAFKKIVKADAL